MPLIHHGGHWGVTLIPAFSLGRTQELLYELNPLLGRRGEIIRLLKEMVPGYCRRWGEHE